MIDVKKEIDALSPSIITWRRELHQIPECGSHLPKTAAYVCQKLEEMGIEYQTYPDHSGISAVIGKKEGKVLALRADMDALPVQEENEVDFISQHPGNMHACGHDCHTAVLLGAASFLKAHEDELPGKVKLIFQPAEEVPPGGAIVMREQGVLENPHVDAVLGLHVGNTEHPELVGTCMYHPGGYLAGDDGIRLTIRGRGGHASKPEDCIDPITITAAVITDLQSVISRTISPFETAVVSFTDIHGGTGTDNVIPDEVAMIGTIRVFDPHTRERVLQKFRDIVDGVVKGYGASYHLEFVPGYPPLVNDEKITADFVASTHKLYGKEGAQLDPNRYTGGDDFAIFLEKVPGCYFTLATDLPAKDGTLYPPHNARFAVDDSVLYRGCGAMVQYALDFLSQES